MTIRTSASAVSLLVGCGAVAVINVALAHRGVAYVTSPGK